MSGGLIMKIKVINKIHYETPIPVYDIINVYPYNNYLIKTGDTLSVVHNCLERMGSRFMVNGKIAGKLFMVSSKKSEYDFLESYIRKKKDNPHVLVCDSPLWEVKPSRTYSGKKFCVALGGSNKASRIVPNELTEYDIQLDNGTSYKLRYNDKVKLHNGSIKTAQDIVAGDNIEEIISTTGE